MNRATGPEAVAGGAARDQSTADAFAKSWNHLPVGSIYSVEQFEEWLAPLSATDVSGARVLELGCGGGNLLVHLATWQPREVVGVDLGDSVVMAERNIAASGFRACRIERHDLCTFAAETPYDIVYCIGVLHHLQQPDAGFDAVLRNTRAGGRFHCWVYAYEGNGVIRWIVDPLRRLASRLPWWFTKHVIATLTVAPYFVYAKVLASLRWPLLRRLPLYEYSLWIASRGFGFFRHVAFDQLVTPQTAYLRRDVVDGWLRREEVEPGSTYVVHRNGNSWKFGGVKR